jgi:hypothetical protein
MSYKWPLTVRRSEDIDSITFNGVPVDNDEITRAVDFVWSFLRDKPGVATLKLDSEIPTVLLCALMARLSPYYRLISVGGIVIHSVFVENQVGSKL